LTVSTPGMMVAFLATAGGAASMALLMAYSSLMGFMLCWAKADEETETTQNATDARVQSRGMANLLS